MQNRMKIGVIGGAGWLGQAIAKALLRSAISTPSDLILSYRSRKAEEISGVHWTTDNQFLADHCDIIILSVRPEDWKTLKFDAKEKLVISVMAGIKLDALIKAHNTQRVVRALPNAAAEFQQSFTPWFASQATSEENHSIVRAIFDACGTQDQADDERQIDYYTVLTGSGPAFPALLAQVMIRHDIEFGIAPHKANKAVRMLLTSAATMLESSEETPAEIITRLTNYRGTTAAALEAMRAHGFDEAVGIGLSSGFQKALSIGGTE